MNNINKEGLSKVILLDMDDVLADFNQGWLDAYNEDYKDTLVKEDLIDWDITKFMKNPAKKLVSYYLCHKHLYLKLVPKPHAKEVIQRWIDKGYTIMVVTDSPMSSFDGYFHSNPTDEKKMWLKEHFPMISASNFITTSQKWFVYGDVLVDDRPTTIEKFEELGRKIIAFDMPYNRTTNATYRCKDWLDLERIIYEMFEECIEPTILNFSNIKRLPSKSIELFYNRLAR